MNSSGVKWCRVDVYEGRRKVDEVMVDLPLPLATPLRPRHAKRAAIKAGRGFGVRVWSWDSYGYAVYPESARLMVRRFKWEGED